MNFFKLRTITEYYDVTIIIFLPPTAELFRSAVLQNISYYERNGIEVLLLANYSFDKVFFSSLLKDFPHINWKVIYGDCSENSYLNNESLYNILQHVSNKYLLILDANCIFITDVIYQLRYALENAEYSYALAKVVYEKDEEKFQEDNYNFDKTRTSYSCILVDKENLRKSIESKISITTLSDLMICLDTIQLKRIKVGQAISVNKICDFSVAERKFYYLNSINVSSDLKKMASDQFFNYKLVFDSKLDKRNIVMDQLFNQFEEFDLNDHEILKKHFPIICLIQIKNESNNIADLLSHLDSKCDGIIILDDGSIDDSYDKAVSDKILLKVKKKHSDYFNDLDNRNLLLQLGNLFISDWFFFIDADERFHISYSQLRDITRLDNVDSVTFRLVHLWNNSDYYRMDIPEGNNGILRRYRMFRNKGFMQIHSNREIHFSAIPFRRNEYHSEVLILHYGIMNEIERKEKYHKYLKQDASGHKQGYNYAYLLDDNISLGNIWNL